MRSRNPGPPVLVIALIVVESACVIPALGFGGNNGTVCPQPGGADLICGDISSMPANYVAEQVDGEWYDAFSFAHTECNIGDANMLTLAFPSNQHEAVAQHLYKLKDGRIEQIGLSWLFHGFAALAGNICGCGCNGQGGTVLGAGCSDPYTASTSGAQGGLSPRWQVNAHTAFFPAGGPANPPFSGTTMRRLRAESDELEPSSADVKYFVERLYITPTEASGKQNNNASYRPVTITGGPTEFAAAPTGTTVRERSAIRAWRASDPAVGETDIQLPDEGLFILAAKATHVSGNVWNYEYALANMNSDLSGQAFAVPLPPGAVITNIGFHDVEYHSGDAMNNFTDPNLNFSGEDWQVTISNDAIQWSSETYERKINANALRWGTMYNFRFNANRPPLGGNITLTTYKVVDMIDAFSVVPSPSACPPDVAPVAQPDSDVNVDDLLAVINSWGPCVPGNCPADITGDGQVNVDDLLAVLNAWGPCR